jgi:hypothetical protein
LNDFAHRNIVSGCNYHFAILFLIRSNLKILVDEQKLKAFAFYFARLDFASSTALIAAARFFEAGNSVFNSSKCFSASFVLPRLALPMASAAIAVSQRLPAGKFFK